MSPVSHNLKVGYEARSVFGEPILGNCQTSEAMELALSTIYKKVKDKVRVAEL